MVMSMRLGDAMSGSWRQKLDTGISTEAYLVGIDDSLKSIMLGLFFIQYRGYEVTKNILMQDNKSTILLAKNGRFSSSKSTKHIKNRKFMIKDKIVKGEIVIQYCPTGEMCADINTKALQGILFYKMCGRMMVIDEYYDDDIERLNTHPDLIPSQEFLFIVSAEDASVLMKAGAIVKFLAVAKAAFPNATKKTQAAVAYLILNRNIARRDRGSSSHIRSVLRYKGKALRTGGKGTRTDKRCPNPRPPDLTGRQRLTNRKKYLFVSRYVTVSARRRLTNRQKYIC